MVQSDVNAFRNCTITVFLLLMCDQQETVANIFCHKIATSTNITERLIPRQDVNALGTHKKAERSLIYSPASSSVLFSMEPVAPELRRCYDLSIPDCSLGIPPTVTVSEVAEVGFEIGSFNTFNTATVYREDNYTHLISTTIDGSQLVVSVASDLTDTYQEVSMGRSNLLPHRM